MIFVIKAHIYLMYLFLQCWITRQRYLDTLKMYGFYANCYVKTSPLIYPVSMENSVESL